MRPRGRRRREPWDSGGEAPRDLLFVLRLPECEEQAHGDRVGVELGERLQVERLELAVPPDAPSNADTALERDEWLGMLGAGPVQMRARLAPEVEQVLEALRRDECRPGAAALEERVRRDRGAVGEAVGIVGAHRRSSLEHRLLLARASRHLGGPDLAVRDEHGVGEGPADVDSQRTHRRILRDRPQ